MFSTETIDINKLYSQGYCITTLDKIFADKILKDMKEETWVEIQPDDEGLEDGMGDKYYTKRFMSARSLLKPTSLRPSYKFFSNRFKEWAEPVLRRFESAPKSVLSAFCGVTGYSMEAHSDVGDRAVFDVIAFFGDDIDSEQDGGVLNIYKTNILDPYNTENLKLIDKIIPSHGKVVVLNNLSPIFYHEVTELVRKGAKRYQLIGNFGMLEFPDWNYDFEEKPGFLQSVEPGQIGVCSSIMDLLEKYDSKEEPLEE